MMLTLLPKGTVVRFEYRDSGDQRWMPRLAILWFVRDLAKKPLSTKALAERPDLERGRYMMRAYDLARQDYRSFYAERIRDLTVTDLHPLLVVATTMQRCAEMDKRTA